jgi:two-component system response regulator VicR
MKMSKIRILIAEDDPNLGQILKEFLELKGYSSTLARDGDLAIQSFKNELFDLCILDIMMPKKDGFEVAEQIKRLNQNVPFIFLTARSQQKDTLRGLQLGADDYIKKPFSMEELDLRIKAILRRSEESEVQSTEFELGEYTFDYIHQTLSLNGEKRNLTSKEAELLLLLAQSKNKILERSSALKIIWGDDSYFNARSMDVYINKLRKHLSACKQVQIITVHGQGFRLVIDK